MRTLPLQLACLSFVFALVACGGDGTKTRLDAGSEPEPDAAVDVDPGEGEPEPEPEPDASTPEPGAVPLTVWVDDLIDHHTDDQSEPDTVDDKVITDDTDESSFDKYLP